jgi:desert hedgehog
LLVSCLLRHVEIAAEFDEDHGCVYLGGELASNTGSIAPGPVTDPSREKGFKLGGAKESATPEADNGDVKNGSASAAGDGKSGTVFGEPTTPSTKDSSSKCFPAVATVELESGVTVRMDALAVGDRVKVGVDTYSEVIMFSHALGTVESEFISLTTASGATLTLTGGHYLYANGELVAASAVNVGDRLTLASGAESPVTHVSAARGVGLYNPQTLHGDVVVEGVVSSTYTTAVEPGLAHGALLAPARALFRLRLGSALVGLLDDGASALAHLLPGGAVVA